MYNRYVPQSDGTWKRNRVSSPQVPSAPLCGPAEPPICSSDITPPCEPSLPPQRHSPSKKANVCSKPAGAFLQNLLPADFDTGDLLILLLLLLMAGDNPEDRDHALLTLAIYFFL